ncbi:MAG: hypothetical protein JSV78_06355 [Phycisphaerales bacterium]|nr:MAG: hypothetical protein JSV78_06355 [Phycisphaerales bacterium]
MTIDSMLSLVVRILPGALVGGAVMVIAAWAGWRIGRGPHGWLVRATQFWLEHVVRPILATRSWPQKAALIALNNSIVCAALVLLGALGPLAWLAVAGVGLALGLALRLLIDLPETQAFESPKTPQRKLLMRIGLALNMLEPPAILLAAGLSLAQGAWRSDILPGMGLAVFARIILPLLVLAACGEALWLTACQQSPTEPE